MPEAIGLMRAILGERAADADHVFNDALTAEVDPLHWCAVELGIGEAEVMRRAAQWTGLAFFDVIPSTATPSLTPDRLANLAEVRILRLRLYQHEVAFVAPDFFRVLRLRRMFLADPALHSTICLVPYAALREHLIRTAEEALLDGARQTLARHWPHAVAQLDLTKGIRWSFLALLVTLVLILTVAPLGGQPWAILVWFALVVLPAILRLAALVTPPPEELPLDERYDIADLPLYTVLVPLRDEANMVDQIAESLKKLNYPLARLEVIFVVESRSPDTIHAVRRHLSDPRFSLIVVPDAMPRTKPKALGFVLPFCQGEFLVVFDAEDRPEPDQLRRVVSQFRGSPDVECIQARLVIDNGLKGWLPALFAGEYAGQFAVVVPALARWGAVTPLGGTSNHFRAPM